MMKIVILFILAGLVFGHVGDPPVCVLTVDDSTPFWGQTVTFDLTGSSDDYAIAICKWSWTNDIAYDETENPVDDLIATHVYKPPFDHWRTVGRISSTTYTCRGIVIDKVSQADTDTVDVKLSYLVNTQARYTF